MESSTAFWDCEWHLRLEGTSVLRKQVTGRYLKVEVFELGAECPDSSAHSPKRDVSVLTEKEFPKSPEPARGV